MLVKLFLALLVVKVLSTGGNGISCHEAVYMADLNNNQRIDQTTEYLNFLNVFMECDLSVYEFDQLPIEFIENYFLNLKNLDEHKNTIGSSRGSIRRKSLKNILNDFCKKTSRIIEDFTAGPSRDNPEQPTSSRFQSKRHKPQGKQHVRVLSQQHSLSTKSLLDNSHDNPNLNRDSSDESSLMPPYFHEAEDLERNTQVFGISEHDREATPDSQLLFHPTFSTTSSATKKASHVPTVAPTLHVSPSHQQRTLLSAQPSWWEKELPLPSAHPTQDLSLEKSSVPSATTSSSPSALPTLSPSTMPSISPSGYPSVTPSFNPTSTSRCPSDTPSLNPRAAPSSSPSATPSSSTTTTLIPNAKPNNAGSSLRGASDVPSDGTEQNNIEENGHENASLRPSNSPSLWEQELPLPSSHPTVSPEPSGTYWATTFEPTETFGPSLSVAPSPKLSPMVPPLTPPSVTSHGRPSAYSTNILSSNPSTCPSSIPSISPSLHPSVTPSSDPFASPSNSPSAVPSLATSMAPSVLPSHCPSEVPSAFPSSSPYEIPSIKPSSIPSVTPSFTASGTPSSNPTEHASRSPSSVPSTCPSQNPSLTPSSEPSTSPSIAPSATPSYMPSMMPAASLSSSPSVCHSNSPSTSPSAVASESPSIAPSVSPTYMPSIEPAASLSNSPSVFPSDRPISNAVASRSPSIAPSVSPSYMPQMMPAASLLSSASDVPFAKQSSAQSATSAFPSVMLSSIPSSKPSASYASIVPTISHKPSMQPSSMPTMVISALPSKSLSFEPFFHPTISASQEASEEPSTNIPPVILILSRDSAGASLSPSDGASDIDLELSATLSDETASPSILESVGWSSVSFFPSASMFPPESFEPSSAPVPLTQTPDFTASGFATRPTQTLSETPTQDVSNHPSTSDTSELGSSIAPSLTSSSDRPTSSATASPSFQTNTNIPSGSSIPYEAPKLDTFSPSNESKTSLSEVLSTTPGNKALLYSRCQSIYEGNIFYRADFTGETVEMLKSFCEAMFGDDISNSGEVPNDPSQTAPREPPAKTHAGDSLSSENSEPNDVPSGNDTSFSSNFSEFAHMSNSMSDQNQFTEEEKLTSNVVEINTTILVQPENTIDYATNESWLSESLVSNKSKTEPRVVRAYNSWEIANLVGLTAATLTSTPHFEKLVDAYVIFVSNILAALKDMNATHGRRHLAIVFDSESANVYKLIDTSCPASLPPEARCQIAFGQVDLMVMDDNPKVVFGLYSNASQLAIDTGKLQKSLMKVDVNSEILILGTTEMALHYDAEKEEYTSLSKAVYVSLGVAGVAVSVLCVSYFIVRRRVQSDNDAKLIGIDEDARAFMAGDTNGIVDDTIFDGTAGSMRSNQSETEYKQSAAQSFLEPVCTVEDETDAIETKSSVLLVGVRDGILIDLSDENSAGTIQILHPVVVGTDLTNQRSHVGNNHRGKMIVETVRSNSTEDQTYQSDWSSIESNIFVPRNSAKPSRAPVSRDHNARKVSLSEMSTIKSMQGVIMEELKRKLAKRDALSRGSASFHAKNSTNHSLAGLNILEDSTVSSSSCYQRNKAQLTSWSSMMRVSNSKGVPGVTANQENTRVSLRWIHNGVEWVKCLAIDSTDEDHESNETECYDSDDTGDDQKVHWFLENGEWVRREVAPL